MVNCSTQSLPIIIGHRGAMGYIAENTLPSIKKAMDPNGILNPGVIFETNY